MTRLSTFIAAVIVLGSAAAAEHFGYANWEQIGQGVIIATLFVLVYQVIQERKSRSFEVFRNLLKDYSEIVAEEAAVPVLADIWLPADADRKAALDKAQKERRIGAWQIMDAHERRQYWRTRRVFDIFEMAFLARKDLWLNKALWARWENLIRVWCGTRYFDYVFEDTGEKYSSPFKAYLEKTRNDRINPTAERQSG